jgi:hypothetical protein
MEMGVNDPIETNIAFIQANNYLVISDKYNYTSYSAGLNYKLNDVSAVFARYSLGASGRAADEVATPLMEQLRTVDQVGQLEVGYKKREFDAGYKHNRF